MLRTLRSLLTALALAVAATSLAAQRGSSADSTTLEFLGFKPGAPLVDVASQLRLLSGDSLQCIRARRDSSVSECRAGLFDPANGRPLALWLSAMDSLSGVLTVSGVVTALQLEGWKNILGHRYGEVGASVQGAQWMMQWVHRGRMIRLTWRLQRGKREASVSLVDGRVLDAWGARSHQP